MFALICEYTYGVFGSKKVLIRRDFYGSVFPGSYDVVTALVLAVWVDVVENFWRNFFSFRCRGTVWLMLLVQLCTSIYISLLHDT